MRSLMTPKMQRRIDNIEEVRRLRPTVSQHDAVSALNAARDDVSLACRLLPQVCDDSARRREAALRRQRDKHAEIDFLEGDEVMVRGLQSRAELNGGLGVVQRFNAKRGRYIVLLEQTRTTVAVKGVCRHARARAYLTPSISFPHAMLISRRANQASTSSRWTMAGWLTRRALLSPTAQRRKLKKHRKRCRHRRRGQLAPCRSRRPKPRWPRLTITVV